MIDWQPFAELVKQHQRFVLTSHIRPDCDALGSELGMAFVLEALGKDVKIVNGQSTPPNIAFIDPESRIQSLGEDITAEQLQDREVLIVLDTSAWIQLGSMAEVVREFSGQRVVIDHHVSQDEFHAAVFKDTGAEATGRLVVDAAAALGVSLTQAMASPLYAAIATDTGWFRFPSSTGNTYRVVGQLLDAGARPAEIYQQLYERDTPARVRLRGRVLERIELEFDNRFVHSFVQQQDFDELGALPSDTENVINMTMAVEGTEVAVLFMEQPHGGVKVSFRSRGGLDCNRAAAEFGGGGHKAAAGASMDQSLAEARPLVLNRLRELIAQLAT